MSTYVRWMTLHRDRTSRVIEDKNVDELKSRLVNEIESSLKDDRQVPKVINKVNYDTSARKFKVTQRLKSKESRKNKTKLGLDRQFACEKLTPDHKSKIFMNPRYVIGLIVNPDYVVKEFKCDIVSNSNVTRDGILNPKNRDMKRINSRRMIDLNECIFDPRIKLDKPCFIGMAVTTFTDPKLIKLANELSDGYNLPIKEVAPYRRK